MANNRLVIEGLDPLWEMPRQLQSAANTIVQRGAEQARDRLIEVYPHITGELEAGVKLQPYQATNDSSIKGWILKSTTFYAMAYEFGARGGAQRPRPTFVPITRAARADIFREVVAMTKATGLVVPGA